MTFGFYVFDVGHGFCAYLQCPNGSNALFDCGYDSELFYPSIFLRNNGIKRINHLYLSHFDQDHICDLPNVRAECIIDVLYRNPTFPGSVMRQIKAQEGGITSSMESAISMHETWTGIAPQVDFGDVTITSFYNSYPDFTDTNNLSMVTFVEYDGLNIIIPGDLKTAGWGPLLQNFIFRAHLAKVNVFIASHHGRDEGYRAEVFQYCKPQIIILSDKNIVHLSQEHDYTKHATGVPNGKDSRRYVYTTRSDGHIRINKSPGQSWIVTPHA